MKKVTFTIEAHNTAANRICLLEHIAADDVAKYVEEVMRNPTLGGLTVYRTPHRKGGGQGAEVLGLVGDEPVAGGNGALRTFTYCHFCETTGGHAGDCVVIS
jgi:hypothetical protein